MTSLTVNSGNIQLGTPYISNGKIYIQINSESTNEGGSTITLSGITINTLTGISEGTVSVRQEEPTGNDSNFYYAYYDPRGEEYNIDRGNYTVVPGPRIPFKRFWNALTRRPRLRVLETGPAVAYVASEEEHEEEAETAS